MIKKIIYSFLTLLFITNLPAQNQDCWSIFRGNSELHGVAQGELPSSPKLLWSYQTEDNIKSSPAVCNDIVVVGSIDGCIHALDIQS